GLLVLPRPGLQVRKSVNCQIIEKLIAAGDDGIGFIALRDAIGCNISHQVYDLRKIGVLAPSTHAGGWTRPEEEGPPIPLGTPVKLSADAIAKLRGANRSAMAGAHSGRRQIEAARPLLARSRPAARSAEVEGDNDSLRA